MAQYPREVVFPLKAGVAATLLQVDRRNVAGEGRRPANVNRPVPINFCGGPDEIIAQLKQAGEEIGAGVVDLSFQTPGSEDPDALRRCPPRRTRRHPRLLCLQMSWICGSTSYRTVRALPLTCAS